MRAWKILSGVLAGFGVVLLLGWLSWRALSGPAWVMVRSEMGMNGGAGKPKAVRNAARGTKAANAGKTAAPGNGRKVAAGAAWAGTGLPPILQVGATDGRGSNAPPYRFAGQLCRELQRQALLIAARDGLGWRTRDLALGEAFTPNADGEVATALVATGFKKGEATAVVMAYTGAAPHGWGNWWDLRVRRKGNRRLGEERVQAGDGEWPDYAALTTAEEAASRGAYVELLKRANLFDGYAGKPETWGTGAADPAAVAALVPMNAFSQFTAVRLLHAQIRREGFSPERLDALVRGYANLGYLTQHLWNGSSKAYAARALLYAQRGVVEEKGSAESLYTRAYARAMVGLHRLALEDLKAADAARAGAQAPAWEGVIAAWCRYDRVAENDAAGSGPTVSPLGDMLAMDILFDGYSQELEDLSGKNFMREYPQCFEVMQKEWLDDEETSGDAIKDLLEELPVSLHDRLRGQLDGAAEKLRAALPSKPGRAYAGVEKLRVALEQESRAGGDAGEPTLGALSALVAEEAFVPVVYQLQEQRDVYGDDVKEQQAFLKESLEAWSHAPMSRYAEMFGKDYNSDHESFRALLDKVRVRDGGEWALVSAGGHLFGQDYADKNAAFLWGPESALDPLPEDLTVAATQRLGSHAPRLGLLEQARHESPYSAGLFRGWMELFPKQERLSDQKKTDGMLTEAEKNFGGKSRVMRIAAEWAMDANEPSRAIHMLEQLQKADPSTLNLMDTVQIAAATGQFEKAMAAEKAAEALPGNWASGNATIQSLLIRMVDAGRMDLVRPYVDSLKGNVFFNWLAGCYDDVTGDRNGARAVLESMQGDVDGLSQWYGWAKRMQDASQEEAQRKLQAYLKGHRGDGDRYNLSAAREMAIIDGDSKAAAAVKRADFSYGNVEDIAASAVADFEAGETSRFDHLLSVMTHYDDPSGFGAVFRTVAKAKHLAHALNAYDAWSALRWHIDALPCDEDCLIGRLLAAQGHKAEAVRYLTRVVRGDFRIEFAYSAAWIALQRLGESPADLAKKGPAVDTTNLLGKWQVTVDGKTMTWTFAADGTVTSTGDMPHARWFVREGHVLVAFAPREWATLKLPVTRKMAGDCWIGEGGVEATKDN